MSERYTEVSLPGQSGVVLNGRVSRADAVGQYRKFMRRQMQEAALCLDAPDEQLRVITYTGVHARRNIEIVSDQPKDTK